MAMPPLKSLYYFSVVAEQRSIKAAAAQLFVTQAAVSQQIKTLEAALDLTLFKRKHRALVLTPEGRQLLPYLTQAFETIREGVQSLRDDDAPNVLTISVLPSFASRWLIPRLQDFYRRYPELTINLSMSEKLEDFSDGNTDLAVRFGQANERHLTIKTLMKECIYPVCHRDYWRQKPIKTAEDLHQERLIDDIDCFGHISWDHWFTVNGLDKEHYSQRQRYDGSHYVIESALSEQGIAMVRHSLAAELVKQGSLVRLFSDWDNGVIDVTQQHYVCAPEHHFQRQKVSVFCEWLQVQAKQFIDSHVL